jgi:hypothetical protein
MVEERDLLGEKFGREEGRGHGQDGAGREECGEVSAEELRKDPCAEAEDQSRRPRVESRRQ